MRKFLFVAVVIGVVLLSMASAQTVVQRVKLGNSVEGITYVPTGPLAKHIVIIDGETLYGVPAEGQGSAPFLKLFDLDSLGYFAAPRGVGYTESEKLFIFSDPAVGGASTRFQLADHQGRSKGSIVFQWPADYVDGAPYTEGIAWIPLDAARYAGDFVFVAPQTAGDFLQALMVMDRKGNLVKEILLNQDPNSPYYLSPAGVAYRNGRLLLSTLDGNLFEVDFDGNVTGPPVFFEDAISMEGVASLAKGRVVVTSHSNGKLIYLDANLNREAGERSYKTGLGLSYPLGVAWNSSTNEYIVYSGDNEPTLTLPQLGAVAADGKSVHLYFDMAPFGNALFGRMDYQPIEDAIVMPWRNTNPRKLEFFRPTGAYDGPVLGDGSPNYRLAAFGYLSGVGYLGRSVTSATVLKVFDLAGQDTGIQFDVAAYLTPGTVILDVAPFSVSGELRVLVLTSDTPKRLLTFDSLGNLLAASDATSLNSDGMLAVKYVSSGPNAGAFVGVDNSRNELVVFRLP